MNDKALAIERIYQKIEMEILQLIGEMIGQGADIGPDGIQRWQMEHLKMLGELNQRQIEIMAKYSKLTVNALEDYIQEQAYATLKKIDSELEPMIEQGFIERMDGSNTLLRVVESMLNYSIDSFNLINATMMGKAHEAYTSILTQASVEALSGTKTVRQAVDDVMEQWGEKGIPALIRKDGVAISAEGYIPMVVRGTQKLTAVQMQESRYDDYELDLVMISSHIGSRPSHYHYQGKIYSRSGSHPDYPPLESTGYGQIDGLITGINCRHQMFAYVEGLSKNNWPKLQDKSESDQRYKEFQKQRKLERDVRKAKKVRAMLESSGADQKRIDEASQKVRYRQKKIREYVESHNLKRNYSQEKVYE